MTSTKSYKRWLTPILNNALKTRRVLILAGPRQCGKTTLAEALTSPKVDYRTLDDPIYLNAALEDPRGFVNHDKDLMIIDEVQRAPLLLPVIKQAVDINKTPGRFLLTGSANIQSLPNVKESLAGRVRKLRLRPLAQGELSEKKPHFLPNAFEENFIIPKRRKTDKPGKESYLIKALKGGYPEALTLSTHQEQAQWFRDYIDALIERDLKDIINIQRQDNIKKLVEVLAGWSSRFMNITSICSSLNITRETLLSYINALEALFLVERLRPWATTDYNRINKQDKLFMTDTGLMSTLLNWNLEKVQFDGSKNGKLLETFVFNELTVHLDTQEDYYQLFHYRDRDKREIDFIVENEAGALLLIDVKGGTNLSADDFKHIKFFRERLASDKKTIGIILHSGDDVVSFGKNLWAVPISAFWG